MAAKWTVRLLALGGMTVALGCRSTPGMPVITTPLYPEIVAGGSPAPPLPGTTLAGTKPDAMVTWPSSSVGAQLPKPMSVAATSSREVGPLRMEEFKSPPVQPSAGPVLPPTEPAPLLVNLPKPPEPVATQTVIKPLLVAPPRPPAGPDGFAPAAIIPPPDIPQEYVKPVIVNNAPSLQPSPLPTGEQFGHASDYRWVAGTLDHYAKGGYWTLRYADLGTDDEWGGKVRLLNDPKLRDCHDGDVVYIHGELLAPRRANLAEGSYPPYRITDLRLIENR